MTRYYTLAVVSIALFIFSDMPTFAVVPIELKELH
jgi:hypothetical protein